MSHRSHWRSGWALAALSSLALCIGCNTPTPPAPSPAGDASGPVQPKVNRVVLSLDPQATESNQAIDSGLGLRPMYETLLDVSLDTGKFVPMLAESWAIGSGGTSIQFKLRKGVPFHDGKGELTSKDVDATYEAIATSQLTGTTVTYVRTNVDRRELPNDYEIILHMKQPDSQFLEYVSSQTQGAYIINAAQLSAEGQPNTAGKPLVGTAGPLVTVPADLGPAPALSTQSYVNSKNLDFFSENFPRDHGGINPLSAEAVAFFKYPDGTQGLVSSINQYWQNGVMMSRDLAHPGRIVFYKKMATASDWQTHAVSVQQQARPCIHARKVLVADFNRDLIPDFAIMCHGWDAHPYPGERNTILLSQSDGYVLAYMSNRIDFHHGGSTADFNGDRIPDIAVTTKSGIRVYINNGTGSFTESSTYTIPVVRTAFHVELVDLNGDGHFDVVAGGHEWDDATRIIINPGNNQFGNARSDTISTVPGAGVIVDFVYAPSNNSLYILRTGDGRNNGTVFYQGLWLQKYSLTTRISTVVLTDPNWTDSRFGYPSRWLRWIDEENGYIVSQWGNAIRIKVD
ncbi:MAG: hypothetical protein EXR52_00690 [Dehalococcoidia bacterium]|nr:hypothetical protein [Dehalococcoidia bacterium]